MAKDRFVLGRKELALLGAGAALALVVFVAAPMTVGARLLAQVAPDGGTMGSPPSGGGSFQAPTGGMQPSQPSGGGSFSQPTGGTQPSGGTFGPPPGGTGGVQPGGAGDTGGGIFGPPPQGGTTGGQQGGQGTFGGGQQGGQMSQPTGGSFGGQQGGPQQGGQMGGQQGGKGGFGPAGEGKFGSAPEGGDEGFFETEMARPEQPGKSGMGGRFGRGRGGEDRGETGSPSDGKVGRKSHPVRGEDSEEFMPPLDEDGTSGEGSMTKGRFGKGRPSFTGEDEDFKSTKSRFGRPSFGGGGSEEGETSGSRFGKGRPSFGGESEEGGMKKGGFFEFQKREGSLFQPSQKKVKVKDIVVPTLELEEGADLTKTFSDVDGSLKKLAKVKSKTAVTNNLYILAQSLEELCSQEELECDEALETLAEVLDSKRLNAKKKIRAFTEVYKGIKELWEEGIGELEEEVE